MESITRTTPVEALPELLFIEEAATWLGVSRSLVYEMIATGRLPAVRLGRLLRVRRDGLERLVTEEGD